MVGTKLPQELRNRVLELFSLGATSFEILAATGVKQNTTNAWLRKNGERQNYTPEERERLKRKALKMLSKGKTVLQIRKTVDVSKGTVYVWTRPYREDGNFSSNERLVFGGMVDELRRRRGLSYTTLGEFLGVTCQQAGNYCRGIYMPESEKRKTLLKLLNLDKDKKLGSWNDFVDEVKTLSRVYS